MAAAAAAAAAAATVLDDQGALQREMTMGPDGIYRVKFLVADEEKEEVKESIARDGPA